MNLPPSIEPRVVDPDSLAYALIGKRCYFCHIVIEKKDVTPPRKCMESAMGHCAHYDCYEYIMKKYWDVPIKELEGKIVRLNVRQFSKSIHGY